METTRTHELEAVRQRRAELRDTLDAMERALAAPGAARAVVWGEQLHTAVDRLASDFALHVEVTEGPDGLHQAILAGDLRLTNQVAALVEEHKTIAADIAALAAVSEAPVAPADVPAVREEGTTLLGRVVRHRQRGADLIYEAYATDIGGCD
jgi:ParB-like chromosome segregation protein Spo0J